MEASAPKIYTYFHYIIILKYIDYLNPFEFNFWKILIFQRA